MSNKEKAVAILNALASGDTTPLEQFISDETYIQHNLSAPSGKAAFLGMVPMLANDPNTKVNIVRVIEDGGLVVCHTEYFLAAFGGALVGFDVFRFENGLVVEHWDNLQAIATETASGRTQLDGPTDVTDHDKTEANRTFAQGFVNDILMGKALDKITAYISTETYHQHNPSVGDGLAAFGEASAAMAEAGTPMVYSQNHLLAVEGNFAFAASEGQFLGNHVAFFDLIRIENGLIVEHWDVIQEIPAKEEWQNDNGKF
ncbi:MAG: nuclear transport factor 2 family protein [Chloroflexota bacterium]